MRKLSTLIVILIFGAGAANAQFSHSVEIKPQIREVSFYRPFEYKANCPDMAAVLRVKVIRRSNSYAGTVLIEAFAQNKGLITYSGKANQAMIVLYEIRPGVKPKIVGTAPFYHVPPDGTSRRVHIYRNWSVSNEFPASYEARIVYDPDILIDGNRFNDDCNSTNNVRRMRGSAINGLFSNT